MIFFARFKAIDDNSKTMVVRRLMESSTADFSFFYIFVLATFMATLGLLANSAAIVIGSMLIAPILYPILAVALGFVMSDQKVIGRSLFTLSRAFMLGIGVSILTTLLFSEGSESTSEILLRTDATVISAAVAIVSGIAVSFALAQKDLNEALPGVAVSASLLPPLAVVGIGIATFNVPVIFGSLKLLGVNVLGIIFASMVTFSLMDLYTKRSVADSTIKRESERIEKENSVIHKIIEEDTSIKE